MNQDQIFVHDGDGKNVPVGAANPLPVSVSSLVVSSTGASANVGDSGSVATLIAANAARKGATIYNDSSALLYVKLGSAASTTSFSVLLAGNGGGIGGFYEIPFGYTGIITGIWASDAGGSARVTELT